MHTIAAHSHAYTEDLSKHPRWGTPCGRPEYVSDRSYDLHTTENYRHLIVGAGFRQATGEEISARFVEILQADLERIDALDIEPPVRDKLAQSWRQKLERSQNGDHRWGLFTALK